MIDFVNILLFLPDSRIVLQRRTKDAPTDPGLLGLFGGHVDPGEDPDSAMQRELAEETSLEVEKMTLERIDVFELSAEEVSKPKGERIFMYRTDIRDMNFSVFEGDRAECYTTIALLERNDLAPGVARVIEKLFKTTDK